ncbi:MAG: hypothetical protein ACREMB_25195 [Candidatus Rokuibacteriota bacterium]
MDGQKGKAKRPQPRLDSASVIAEVLRRTRADLKGLQPKNPQLSFAISFARHMGSLMADGLRGDFSEVQSGERPSRAVSGPKRVDVNYSTTAAGLGFAISLKSVHRGEKAAGDAAFTHNMKRNDEELRVEATGHHLRQPYAVLVAVLFLPFESCTDLPTSSFAAWVQYFWPLKGRVEPEDPPDRFELVFVALYARDGSEMGFYRVGGDVKCPRHGRPSTLLTFGDFLDLIRTAYRKRNSKDFYYAGEEPPA